jgi:D-glycero-alpha-D-manno-heptose-7-phosphate kinase
MIISRTPYRLSFFGGGTDFPTWFHEHGGAVLSTSINKYCYLTCRYLPPFFATRFRVVWSQIETINSIEEIMHPAVRGILRHLKFSDQAGIEIHHQGDLPARSGVGSSSSFAAGLIKALKGLRGEMIGQEELAHAAIDLEQNILKEHVGCQDQVAACFGGLNRIHFLPSGGFRVEPICVSHQRLEHLQDCLLLFFTGTSRHSSAIAGDVIANVKNNVTRLHRMRGMVDEAVNMLCRSETSLDDFGHLLHEAWMEKKQLSQLVSNDVVNDIYDTARRAGALGGKLMGSGGSGFVFFYVKEGHLEKVQEALKHLLHVPFRFEDEGSSIIHYRPND